MPNEDVEALEAKLATFEEDLKPQNATQMEFVKRFALKTIRLDRMARQETKTIEHRMRNAASVYDDVMVTKVDGQMSWIASEPATNCLRLKSTVVGLSRLIAAIEGLLSDLLRQPSYLWNHQHCDQLDHYLGKRREVMPISRVRALTEAIHSRFQYIDPAEIPESETLAKRRRAIGQLVRLIEAKLDKLRTLLDTFDHAGLEIDRVEAADRAMFVDSREGILSRKYEEACEWSMYKALKELRELRDHSAQIDNSEHVTTEPSEELGSFFPDPPAEEPTEPDVDPTIMTSEDSTPKRRPNLEKLALLGRRRPSST